MQPGTSKYNLYVTEISVCQGKDNPIFGETVTKVRLQDEAGGMFLEIVQEGNDFNGSEQQVIRVEFEELLEIVKAAGILEGYAKNYQQVDNDVQVEVEYRCGIAEI